MISNSIFLYELQQETKGDSNMKSFINVACAKCGLSRPMIRAKTISGAIKRTTVECDGIVRSKDGIRYTDCHNGFVGELGAGE
jgi:hypothetical protein